MLRLILLFICVLSCAPLAHAQMTINRSKAVIEHRTFNPASPPKEMPKLSPGETAVTQSFFGSEASVGGNVFETQKNPDGSYKASVKVGKIEMTLRMRVSIWTPQNAMTKIVNHEEGHRKIAEHFYDNSEPIARKACEEMIGQAVSGSGKDVQSAVNNAFDNVIHIVGQKYLDQCEAPCNKAQKIYDQITANGTNAIKEDMAVEEAIARVDESK